MTVLTTALNTEFTPTATTFAVNVTGGAANLERKLEGGTIFQNAGEISNFAPMVDNVVGSSYRLVPTFGVPTVRATE
jgi:hypothetical protein